MKSKMTKEEFDAIARDTIAEIRAFVKKKISKLYEETGIMCEGEVNMSCRTLKVAYGIGFWRRMVLDEYDPKSEMPNLSDILKPDTELHQAELGDPKEIDDLDIRRNKELAEDFKEFVEHGNKVGWDKIYEKYGNKH